MIKYLKLAHNWIGFVISIIMLVVLVTGIYLGGVDLLKRLDDKGQTYQPLTHEQKADIVSQAFAKYPDISSVKLPTQSSPFVEASSRSQSVYLTPAMEEIETQVKGENKLWRAIFFFHRNFLLDAPGKHVNAVSAILATVIMFVGIYLWWLVRNGFKWKHTLPRNGKNPALIKSHIQLGILFCVPMIIMAATGAYITYGPRGMNKPAPVTQSADIQAADWYSQVLASQKIWPEKELVSVAKPRQRGRGKPVQSNGSGKGLGKGLDKGQGKMQGKGAGANKAGKGLVYSANFNGDNLFALQQTDTVKVHFQRGEIISAQSYADKGLTYQAKYAARFLHDGARMPTAYLWLLIISSLVGSFMVAFTMTSFVRKQFLKPKR